MFLCLFYVQVIWIRLYKRDSYKDTGTLLQLQSLIDRSNVPLKPKKNVNAAEDFVKVCSCFVIMLTGVLSVSHHAFFVHLQVVMEGHVLAAAMQYFGMTSHLMLPKAISLTS